MVLLSVLSARCWIRYASAKLGGWGATQRTRWSTIADGAATVTLWLLASCAAEVGLDGGAAASVNPESDEPQVVVCFDGKCSATEDAHAVEQRITERARGASVRVRDLYVETQSAAAKGASTIRLRVWDGDPIPGSHLVPIYMDVSGSGIDVHPADAGGESASRLSVWQATVRPRITLNLELDMQANATLDMARTSENLPSSDISRLEPTTVHRLGQWGGREFRDAARTLGTPHGSWLQLHFATDPVHTIVISEAILRLMLKADDPERSLITRAASHGFARASAFLKRIGLSRAGSRATDAAHSGGAVLGQHFKLPHGMTSVSNETDWKVLLNWITNRGLIALDIGGEGRHGPQVININRRGDVLTRPEWTSRAEIGGNVPLLIATAEEAMRYFGGHATSKAHVLVFDNVQITDTQLAIVAKNTLAPLGVIRIASDNSRRDGIPISSAKAKHAEIARRLNGQVLGQYTYLRANAENHAGSGETVTIIRTGLPPYPQVEKWWRR